MTGSPRDAAFAEVRTPTHELGLALDVGEKTTTPKKETTASSGGTDASYHNTSELKDKKTKTPAPPVAFAALYRYATPRDKLCLALGVVCAIASGALFPCMALVFGKAISAFQQADGGVDTAKVNSAALDYLYIALALFVADSGAYVLLTTTAERQMKLLRAEALRHMLYMDIAWYDAHDALQLSSRITGDTVKIKDGMGSKLGETIKYTSQFFTGYAIGLAKGWDTTLVMAAVMPLMALSMGVLVAVIRSVIVQSQQLYAEGGAVAEETLGAIRTVASLNAEKRAIAAYAAKCQVVEDLNVQLLKKASLILGFFMASTWVMYAAGLWYGGYRVSTDNATPMEVFQSFFGVLLGTMAIAMITPSLTAVTEARGAAAGLYEILDTPSAMDASRDEGFVPASCAGRIDAVDLHFAYPSRPDAPILQGYSVSIEAGATVAFVGASGGGKSTLVALLERYYAPQRGQLLLDGRDISTLNVRWLRRQIGVVSQEPVLFAQTILANLVAGASGETVTHARAIAAAKMANAHDFIMALPQQYDTLVGEKGVSLSGGQKQRLAIARAIVRDPAILVLDEATSALDVHSERVVQLALDALMAQTRMTTLVIAHRLSTVRRADKIVVLAGGRVVEQGTHSELMRDGGAGVYRNLYTIQEGIAAQEHDEAATNEEDQGQGETVDLVLGTEQVRSSTRSLSRKSDGSETLVSLKEAQDANEQDDAHRAFSVMDAVELSRPERPFFLVGALAVALAGFAMPGSALLLSQLLTSMVDKFAQYEATRARVFLDELYDDAATYGGAYLGGAAAMWALKATSTYCFRFMGQKLTTRVRLVQFTALCRQNIAFFDDKAHGTGSLTAALATHGTNMASLSGDTLGRLVECVFTFTAAMAISFALGSWQLSLVLLVVFPLLIASEAFRNRTVPKATVLSDELLEVGARASEALCNMRTVASLGLEDALLSQFDALLEAPLRAARHESRVNALSFGFSSFVVFATYALVFWYGGRLVDARTVSFVQMMRTLMAVMMSAQSVGVAASFLGDSKHALEAGASVVALRDRALPIDAFDPSGETPAHVVGEIEFRDVTFAYPTRPGVTVLRHYNLVINAGETVAFCGPSGGGKSTCIALLERFYDPVGGRVLLDGRDLRSLNVQWLRRQLALVGQEPTLFIGTIAQNIAYGLETEPSQQEIEAAARMANAHAFITQFPDGYATQVGMKGEQLSGGQKQRIAIARAVLKDARVLLLDEATSALDSESEKTVQAALDAVVAQKTRTTLVIAHRLSTIRKADKICVVSGGKIAEQGSHAELLAKNGLYTTLVRAAS